MLVLIFGVVLWPVYEMIRTPTLEISGPGQEKGFVGLENYRELFENGNLAGAFARTVFWVVVVVAITILISLFLAQFLNTEFPGRRYVRWALIGHWASSIIMTATSFRWMLDGYYGILNKILLDLGLIDEAVEWFGSASTSFPWLILVAIFVSPPFTTFVMLADNTRRALRGGPRRRCHSYKNLFFYNSASFGHFYFSCNGDKPDQCLQSVPNNLGHDRRWAGLRHRHHNDSYVQAGF